MANFNKLQKHLSAKPQSKPQEQSRSALVDAFLNRLSESWIRHRLPSASELQEAYENCGEHLFAVVIENPSERHLQANRRPCVVREAFMCYDMDTDTYSWFLCDSKTLTWVNTIPVIAWKQMPKAPVCSN